MMRLKDLLSEQSKPKKLRVLFIGDSQTGMAQSYAHELLKQKNIVGKIISKPNATSADVLKMLEDNISERIDIVSIFTGNVDSAQKSPMDALANFKRMVSIIKDFGAKSIIITPPTKQYIQPTDKAFKKTGYPSNEKIATWLEQRSGADVVINTQDLDFEIIDFAKDHLHLDKDAQLQISKIWNNYVTSLTPDEDLENEPIEKQAKKQPEKQNNISKETDSELEPDVKSNVSKSSLISTAVVIDPDTTDVDFYSEILKGIGAPVTDENLKFFYAWRQAEGAKAAFNPFNTTQPMPGATKYNSVGVRNYSSADEGIAATIKTLTNGRYPNILSKLKNNAGAMEIANSLSDLQTWGTGAGVLRVLSGNKVSPPSINGIMSAPKDTKEKPNTWNKLTNILGSIDKS